ncbi:hypothetical protein HHK36_022412 [Tetracentron sinense]|uniref:Uncharacterized protein n=1 Tax=Tetracentron sinense TaxID=13715 RepID=A0A835D6S0_TETSI|nr:hypothetical protein HHK36_022412 [Tetracentron sinense]
MPTPASAAHLGPRVPMPALHVPPIPATDLSRIQETNQSDPALNAIGRPSPNQPQIPNFADPYQHYHGLHQMQVPPPQNQAMAQPSTSKGVGTLENHQSGTFNPALPPGTLGIAFPLTLPSGTLDSAFSLGTSDPAFPPGTMDLALTSGILVHALPLGTLDLVLPLGTMDLALPSGTLDPVFPPGTSKPVFPPSTLDLAFPPSTLGPAFPPSTLDPVLPPGTFGSRLGPTGTFGEETLRLASRNIGSRLPWHIGSPRLSYRNIGSKPSAFPRGHIGSPLTFGT